MAVRAATANYFKSTQCWSHGGLCGHCSADEDTGQLFLLVLEVIQAAELSNGIFAKPPSFQLYIIWEGFVRFVPMTLLFKKFQNTGAGGALSKAALEQIKWRSREVKGLARVTHVVCYRGWSKIWPQIWSLFYPKWGDTSKWCLDCQGENGAPSTNAGNGHNVDHKCWQPRQKAMCDLWEAKVLERKLASCPTVSSLSYANPEAQSTMYLINCQIFFTWTVMW